MHVHVVSQDGEIKFWLEPIIEPAIGCRLSAKQMNEISKLVEEHYDELVSAWKKHFKS
jgi:hypothetical protein